MRRTLGLVLLGQSNTQSTIPPHEISLIGKPLFMHAVEALSSVCERVLVELAKHRDDTDAELIRRALQQMQLEVSPESLDQQDDLIVHDGFQPVVRVDHLRRIRRSMHLGSVTVATSFRYHGEYPPSPRSRQEPRIIEPPAGFQIRALRKYLSQERAQRASISDLARSVADANSATLKVIIRPYVTGRVFHNMSANEAEALLRARATRTLPRARSRGLDGSRVLVLGGTGGIGKACIEALCKEGVAYLAPSRAELDLRFEADFPQLATVDSVIHAAGAYNDSPQEIMEVNFHSCVRLMKAAEASGWSGSIVFLSSTAATYGRRGVPVYSASKAALNSLIEAEAERLAEKDIRVNAVAPAKVATALQERLNPGTPASKMISPAYVARLIVRVLGSRQYGSILYLRKGEDV